MMVNNKLAAKKKVTCKQCGREFKGLRALGGHVRSAHKKPEQDARRTGAGTAQAEQPSQSTAAQPAAERASQPEGQTPAAAPAEPPEPGQGEQIRDLLHEGYSFRQLVDQFHFRESTIRQEMRKLVEPESKPVTVDNGRNDGLLPTTVKLTEIITPEAILQRYMDGDDEEKELRAIMKFRAAILVALGLVNAADARNESQSKVIDATLKLMKESREEMDAAALRAKASVDEAVVKACEGTASRVVDYLEPRIASLEQKKPDIASTHNPMAGVMARSLEAIMNRMTNSLAPGGQQQNAQSSIPQGWTQETVKE